MKFTRQLLVPAMVLALVASSCGGSDDATDATTATTAAPVTSEPATTEPTGGPVGTGTVSDEFALEIDAYAAGYLEAAAANGATAFYVAIDDPDQGTYVAAYGDVGVDGPAATVDDNFRIGSITKTFTATVILQLIDEGELSLDDTVADVSPDLAAEFPDLAELTIEQLLGMTSGIADYFNVPDSVITEVVADPQRVFEPEELIAAGVGAGVDAPGTPGYSTTNYIALQLIAEDLTGQSLQELIDERIVQPADLGNIFLPPNDDTDLPEPLTRGYVAGGCVAEFSGDGADIPEGTDTTDWSASSSQGGGGMTSDITSLRNWAATMSGNELLSDDLAEVRMSNTKRIDVLDYGLGIFRIGTSWWGHEGEAIGWEALSLHDPETGVSIAVASNGCGGQFTNFIFFIDAVYPDGGIYSKIQADQAATTESTEPASDTTAPGTGGDAGEGAGGAEGAAIMYIGDKILQGEITQCTLVEPDVEFIAPGENAQIEVASLGDGDVSVTVSGLYEFEGKGTATFEAGATIDQGNVTITGTGSQPDDSSPTEDFTIDASIVSC